MGPSDIRFLWFWKWFSTFPWIWEKGNIPSLKLLYRHWDFQWLGEMKFWICFWDGLFSKAMLCFRECKMWEVDSFDEASFMSHLRSFTVPTLHTRGLFSHLSLFDSRVAPVSHRWTAVNMERTGVTRFEELRIATVFAGFGSCRT